MVSFFLVCTPSLVHFFIYSFSSFPHWLLSAESLTSLVEKMELNESESAQCPASAPTDLDRHEVSILLHKADPLPKPGSDTLASRSLSVYLSHLQLHWKVSLPLCPFPSSSHALLLPWAPCISSLSLQSVRLSICLSFFASHLHLNLVSSPITSQNCSHKAHQHPWQTNPTGVFQD